MRFSQPQTFSALSSYIVWVYLTMKYFCGIFLLKVDGGSKSLTLRKAFLRYHCQGRLIDEKKTKVENLVSMSLEGKRHFMRAVSFRTISSVFPTKMYLRLYSDFPYNAIESMNRKKHGRKLPRDRKGLYKLPRDQKGL
jgi:hypothetical protein